MMGPDRFDARRIQEQREESFNDAYDERRQIHEQRFSFEGQEAVDDFSLTFEQTNLPAVAPKPLQGVSHMLEGVMKELTQFIHENLREYSPMGFHSTKIESIDVSRLIEGLSATQRRFESMSFPSSQSIRDDVDESSVASAASVHLEEFIAIFTGDRPHLHLSESEQESFLIGLIGLRAEFENLRHQTDIAQSQAKLNEEALRVSGIVAEAERCELSIKRLARLLPGGLIDGNYSRLQQIVGGDHPAIPAMAMRVYQHAETFLSAVREHTPSQMGFRTELTEQPQLEVEELIFALESSVNELTSLYFEEQGHSYYDIQFRSFAHSLLSFTEALLIQVVRSHRDGRLSEGELHGLRRAVARTMKCASDTARQAGLFIEELEEKYREAS